MKPIWMYLDEAKQRGIAASDSEIGRLLGVTRQSVNDWRQGRTAPNEDQAAGLADLLGKPEVMAECMAARARTPEHRAAWERVARLCSQATMALVAGAVVGLAAPSPPKPRRSWDSPERFVLCKLKNTSTPTVDLEPNPFRPFGYNGSSSKAENRQWDF